MLTIKDFRVGMKVGFTPERIEHFGSNAEIRARYLRPNNIYTVTMVNSHIFTDLKEGAGEQGHGPEMLFIIKKQVIII